MGEGRRDGIRRWGRFRSRLLRWFWLLKNMAVVDTGRWFGKLRLLNLLYTVGVKARLTLLLQHREQVVALQCRRVWAMLVPSLKSHNQQWRENRVNGPQCVVPSTLRGRLVPGCCNTRDTSRFDGFLYAPFLLFALAVAPR